MPNSCCYIRQRFVVCALSSIALIVCFLDRQTYFEAIRQMVYNTLQNKHKNSVSSCPHAMDNIHDYWHLGVEFYWDQTLVQAITQSFYIGYLITIIPAGMMADFFGAKRILGVGVLVSSVTALLSPILANNGAYCLLIARFFQGASQGLVFPCVGVLIAQWVPLTERATFSAIINSGQFIGWGLGYVLPWAILPLSESWDIPFYITGVVGIIWFVLWYILASSTPSACNHISQAEHNFIHSTSEGTDRECLARKPYVPWKAMLSSPPVLSMLLLNWAASWVHYTTMNHVEYYLIYVLKMTENKSRSYTILCAIAIAPSSIFWGAVSDWLVNKKYMSRTLNRKLCGFISNMVMIPCLLGMPLAGCGNTTVVALYLVLCYWRGPYYGTFHVNPVDLSPRHAGILMAIMDSTGAISALFSWELVTFICDVPSDISKWETLFLITTGMLLLMSLPYLWFGSAEVQAWNYSQGRTRAAPIPASTLPLPPLS